jgi:hypothetical protein
VPAAEAAQAGLAGPAAPGVEVATAAKAGPAEHLAPAVNPAWAERVAQAAHRDPAERPVNLVNRASPANQVARGAKARCSETDAATRWIYVVATVVAVFMPVERDRAPGHIPATGPVRL